MDGSEERARLMKLRFERLLGGGLIGRFDQETSRHVAVTPRSPSTSLRGQRMVRQRLQMFHR